MTSLTSDNILARYAIPDLCGRNFYIPDYQRGYRWGSAQVEQLLEDLCRFFYGKENQGDFYCLQPVVVKELSADEIQTLNLRSDLDNNRWYEVVDKIKNDEALQMELAGVLKEAGYDTTRLESTRRLVLITGHRRENFGDGFISMCTAIRDLAAKYPTVDFVYPMHLNPNVRNPIHEVFGEDLTRYSNLFFTEPLEYLSFVYLMEKSTIVLTDSGGIQEEAPGLGKPVLVMRDTTERPEALESGTIHLVGTNYDKIIGEVSVLLDDAIACQKMNQAVNPYGDGNACARIADYLWHI